MQALVMQGEIGSKILTLRGQQVMIDSDLAALYGVTTKRLNEQVKRNIARFPSDFMFQLNESEKNELVANCDRFNTMKHSTVNPLCIYRTRHIHASFCIAFDKLRHLLCKVYIMAYIYILKCADGSYYTGSTKNLEQRLWQHRTAQGANHTKVRLPVELMYSEYYERIDEAFAREKQIQKWSRKKKEALIGGKL